MQTLVTQYMFVNFVYVPSKTQVYKLLTAVDKKFKSQDYLVTKWLNFVWKLEVITYVKTRTYRVFFFFKIVFKVYDYWLTVFHVDTFLF